MNKEGLKQMDSAEEERIAMKALAELADVPLTAIWNNPRATELFGELLKVENPKYAMNTIFAAGEFLFSRENSQELERAIQNNMTVKAYAEEFFSCFGDEVMLEAELSDKKNLPKKDAKEIATALKRLYFAFELISPEEQEADRAIEAWAKNWNEQRLSPRELAYAMSPEAFFSKNRLEEVGVPANFATRISRAINNGRRDLKIDGNPAAHDTMRDLLADIAAGRETVTESVFKNLVKSYFLRAPNTGRASVEYIYQVLQSSGIDSLEALNSTKKKPAGE